MRRSTLLMLLTLLTVQLCTLAPGRADAVVERSYDLSTGGRFVLLVDAGDVLLVGTDRPGARLVLEGDSEKIESQFEITAQTAGGALEVRIERERGRGRKLFSSGWNASVEVRVEVPRDTEVRVRTAGGSIEARTLARGADLSTSGGDILAAQIGGPLDAGTSGGSITLEGCQSDVSAATSGGDIDLTGVQGDVEAETSGGSIQIEGASSVLAETSGGNVRVIDARGRVDAETSGGSVRVTFAADATPSGSISTSGGGVDVALPPDADVDLDASASGGNVRCELPVTSSGRVSAHSLRGKLGAGGALLKLRSSGGGIDVVAR